MHTGSPDRSKRAFERLYDRLGRRLLLYLTRRMQDVDAATELWAECWAVAFAGWSGCDARSDSEVEAWVFGVARNQLGHYYRSGKVARRALEQLRWTVPAVHEDDRAEIECDAELAELRGMLSEALGRLRPIRRQAISLRILKGLSYAEVAQRMGCSEQAARAAVSRGLSQLQAYIDREQIGELQGANQ